MSLSDNLDPIVASALASLDRLSPSDIKNLDDFCPICLLTFRAVLQPREDSPLGKAVSGVARVGGCGHLFCVEEYVSLISLAEYPTHPLPTAFRNGSRAACVFLHY